MTYEQTMLSPPYGDRTLYVSSTSSTVPFSSPCGDCTLFDKDTKKLELFSPPYGDCTTMKKKTMKKIAFSPPYGDCTLNISQNTAKLKSRMARKYSLYCNDVLFALKRTVINSFSLPCARGSFMV